MANEREIAPINFGFSDNGVENSLQWLRSYIPFATVDADSERAKLAVQNPPLAAFISEMNELRAATHTPNHGAYAEAHQMGVYFGLELIRNQYGAGSIPSPELTIAARENFLNLLVDEDHTIDTDPDFLELEKSMPEIEGSCLVPGILRRKYLTTSGEALNKVMTRLHLNSKNKRQEVFLKENQLRKITPTIQNIVGNGLDGFLDGLSDIYWPFQMTRIIEPYAQILRAKQF